MAINTKFIKLYGGLGNQMFQYAFGKALEKKLGCEVLYDDYWFTFIRKEAEKAKHFTMRTYELDLFGLKPKMATRQDINNYFAPALAAKISVNDKMIMDTNPYVFDEKMFEDLDNDYYSGYFQNEKYFECIKEEIKKDFTLPEIPKEDKKNTKLLNEIQKSNSVFIHLRRGDYIDLGMVLELEYYKKAVEYIKKNIKNPKFYVFGIDSDEYIAKEFKINNSFKFVGNHNLKNAEDWKDLKLMQECKHAIIANSTFSWWAAYLSDYSGKIVVAPTPWIENQDGIICENWVKIERK